MQANITRGLEILCSIEHILVRSLKAFNLVLLCFIHTNPSLFKFETYIVIDVPSEKMRLVIKQFIAIARLTALESIRQPICLILVTVAIVTIGILPLIVAHSMGEEGKLIRDSALSVYLLSGLFLSAYAACLAITHEIRQGTVSAILTKPVDRTVFILAKFTGVATITFVYALIAGMAVIISSRTSMEAFQIDKYAALPLLAAPFVAFIIAGLTNYFAGRVFVSDAFIALVVMVTAAFLAAGLIDKEGNAQAFGILYDWRLLQACSAIALALLLLQAMAVTISTKLDAVPTLVICSLILILGLMSDFFFGQFADTNTFANIAYHLTPNWQHFWMVDALTGGGKIPWIVVGAVAKYAVLYTIGVLLLAVSIFRSSEIS